MNYVEYVGYAASFFVLLSFVMKRMLILRIVNVIGCSFFIWYGALLMSWPIMVTNIANCNREQLLHYTDQTKR